MDLFDTLVEASKATSRIYHAHKFALASVHVMVMERGLGNEVDKIVPLATEDMERVLRAYREAAPAMDELEMALGEENDE